MSNYAIARHVGVDEATVRNWRGRLTASTEIPQIDTRTVSRQGRTYQQRTTQIGRRRGAKVSAPDAEPEDPAHGSQSLEGPLRAAAAIADCEATPAGFAREILARPDRDQIIARMEKAHDFLTLCLDEIRNAHASGCERFAPAHADDGDARTRQTVA